MAAAFCVFWAGESKGEEFEPAPVVSTTDHVPSTVYTVDRPQHTPQVEFSAPRSAPQDIGFNAWPAEPQMLDARRQVNDGNRQLLDGRREFINSLPARNNAAASDPALSHYYAPVTVNYFVSPEGTQPVRPAMHMQNADTFTDDPYGLTPINGKQRGHGKHGKSCDCQPCCRALKTHCLGIFGESLYLRPGNMDIVYAVEQRGTDPMTATPTGPQGITAPDFSAGFRVGFAMPLSECSSLVASYTWYQSDTNDAIIAAPGTVLGSRVTHPNVANTGANANSASAKFDLDFEFVDLDYHRQLFGDCDWALNYTAGLRYARLVQELEARQQTGVAVGLATVTTDIDFDGLGIRMGLDGERHSSHTGLFIYGEGFVNVLAGGFQANYLQTNQLDPTANIGVIQEDYRLSTILQGELGIGWQSCKGRVRGSVGYQGMGWHNAFLTGAFIDNLGTGQLTQTNDNFLTFSGAVARIEFIH